MQKLNIEYPFIINGVLFTEKMFGEISWLLTDGTTKNPTVHYENYGVNLKIDAVNNAIMFILGQVADRDAGQKKEEEIKLLSELYYVRSFFDSIKVPDEFVTK